MISETGPKKASLLTVLNRLDTVTYQGIRHPLTSPNFYFFGMRLKEAFLENGLHSLRHIGPYFIELRIKAFQTRGFSHLQFSSFGFFISDAH